MTVHSKFAAFACSILVGSAVAPAQDAAPTRPTAGATARPDASPETPKADTQVPRGAFLVEPYLQPGHSVAAGKVVLMWHAADSDSVWAVETRAAADRPWQAVSKAPSKVRVAVPNIEPHRVYHLALTGLEPGKRFGYRISQDGKVVFEAEGRAPRSPDQEQRFVVFGDCGANSPEQKAIAYRAFVLKPHYVMITGDMVYD